MYKANECSKCKKFPVCKLIEDYNNKCIELTDTNTENYQSRLYCKHCEVDS